MARLIQKSGYIQGGRAARYMEYVAKRDGVEVIQSTEPVTKKQMQFLTKLLKDFPDASRQELFLRIDQAYGKKNSQPTQVPVAERRSPYSAMGLYNEDAKT